MKIVLTVILIGIFNLSGISQNDLPAIKFKKNSKYIEKVIEHEDILINIPIGWRLYSEEETNILKEAFNANSEYKMIFDYYLALESEVDYPNINISVKKSEEFKQISFDQFKDYFKDIYQVAVEKVIDGTRSMITDHEDKDFIVDKKNNRFFVISDGLVANVGIVRSNGVIILIDEYIVSINFAHTLEEYKKYESALLIMANSVRRKK